MYLVICYSVHKKEVVSITNKTTFEDAQLFLEKDVENTYQEELDCGVKKENLDYTIKLSFEMYFDIIKSLGISVVNNVKHEISYNENGYDLGEYVRKCILTSLKINNKLIKECTGDADDYKSIEDDLSFFLEDIHPYITLRILAENPDNSNYELQWRYIDIVEEGWVNRDEIVKELDSEKRILIVTEGSSDSFILRKAIDYLYPDIKDFFDFVDMNSNYPFTGIGNLYNFCMGLCRIKIQNNIMVIFDNDTAGVEKYKKSLLLNKPNTFVITKLPNYEEFCNFITLGPHGESIEDINGKAVAIECFLDLESIKNKPYIRWTTYNKNEKQYQGELINKDEYVREYKQCNLVDGSYNTNKLNYLVEYLINKWIGRE